jgi:hypothetical protein
MRTPANRREHLSHKESLSEKEADMPKRIALALLLLLTMGCSSLQTTPTPVDSGVEGQVYIGPTCPVVKVGQECPDKAYQAVLTVTSPTGEEIVRIQTDENGEFHVPLAPGEYVLHPESPGRYPIASEQSFTVRPGTYTRLVVAYDSGIR